jgi:hypothetical protein
MPVNLIPSNADTRSFKVAAVQAEPVWLDLQGSVAKTISIINEAAANGAKVRFPLMSFTWVLMMMFRSSASPKFSSQDTHGHLGHRTLRSPLLSSRSTRPTLQGKRPGEQFSKNIS